MRETSPFVSQSWQKLTAQAKIEVHDYLNIMANSRLLATGFSTNHFHKIDANLVFMIIRKSLTDSEQPEAYKRDILSNLSNNRSAHLPRLRFAKQVFVFRIWHSPHPVSADVWRYSNQRIWPFCKAISLTRMFVEEHQIWAKSGKQNTGRPFTAEAVWKREQTDKLPFCAFLPPGTHQMPSGKLAGQCLKKSWWVQGVKIWRNQITISLASAFQQWNHKDEWMGEFATKQKTRRSFSDLLLQQRQGKDVERLTSRTEMSAGTLARFRWPRTPQKT